ncbi:MAG: BolA/IbaG family iron-sulfur metabolism protein [Gammaproteobacteria bacterium]|nr:BolA/IbaG family iron-sulfur metabolism protein [Gammaproteobacteria bacterium]
MQKEDIKALIETGMPGAEVAVFGDDGQHFEARIVSDAFEGKNTVQRHRMVYATLGDKMGGEIHALSMQTLTPTEAGGN